MASGINSRAAIKSIHDHYSRLVDLLSIEPQSWAVNFKAKAMIASTSFEKATYTAGFITNSNKAITMLQDIERYIRAGSPSIFKSLVTMIYQKEVVMGRSLNSNLSLTTKLIDVYKSSGGREKIEAALEDVCLPPVHSLPQPLNVASPSPPPEGEQCVDEGARGQGEGCSLGCSLERPIIPKPLSRGEGNGSLSPALDLSQSHLRIRRPHPDELTKPDPPQNQATHPKEKAVPNELSGAPLLLVAGIVVVAVLCIGAWTWFGRGGGERLGDRSRAHSSGQFSLDDDEDIQHLSLPACGHIEVDYLRNQPLMRVLEVNFFSHIEGVWRLVGNSLNMPSHLLDIQQESRSPVKDKLREVIIFWLKGNGRNPHTLGTLANAFRKADFPLLADKLLTDPTLCKIDVF